jgi:hypothetical protein
MCNDKEMFRRGKPGIPKLESIHADADPHADSMQQPDDHVACFCFVKKKVSA